MSEKTITASVGQGGMNIPSDVATVQQLLNCVPALEGGPVPKLEVDGICSGITILAINRFQRVHGGRTKNRVDTVACGGTTINDLKKYDLSSCGANAEQNYKSVISKLNREINPVNTVGQSEIKIIEQVSNSQRINHSTNSESQIIGVAEFEAL